MKMNKFSLIAMIALGGLVALGPLARAQEKKEGAEARPGPREGRGGDLVNRRLERLTEELKLTDEQKPKVEALLKAQAEKMRGLRDATPEERREKMKANTEEMNKKMKEILTAEQFGKWEKQAQERRGDRRGAPGERNGEKPPSDDKK